jgi:Domain of Unknown Function (DUF1206)
MADITSVLPSGKDNSKDIKPWIRGFARIGFISRGLVYMLIGALAVMAAFGVGGSTSDSNGAFAAIASKPFGEVLLWIVGIGLLGVVIWSFIQAITDPEYHGDQGKSIVRRVTHIFTGAAYGILGFNAIAIALHAKGGSSSEQTMSAKLLSQPFGQWIVGIVGLAIIGFALHELYSAYTEKFAKQFKKGSMSKHEWTFSKRTGKIGLTARGIVFLLVGYFFIRTAVTADPDKTKGLDGALSEIAQQPFGKWLLAIVAAGLFLYGVFEILRGKNRHLSIF